MSILYKYGYNYNRNLFLLCGLSTDVKPVPSIEGMKIPAMSSFLEMDTGKVYYYDAIGQKWTNGSFDAIPLFTYDGEILKTNDGEPILTIT